MKYRIKKITNGWGTFYSPQYKHFFIWKFWIPIYEDRNYRYKFKTQEEAMNCIESEKVCDKRFVEGEKMMFEKMQFAEDRIVWSE